MSATCSIDGCSEIVLHKGLCRVHYHRNWRYGDPLAPLRRSPQARMDWLLATIVGAGDDCTDWPYTTTRGYGTMSVPGVARKQVYAHRVVCEHVYGPPPGPRYEAAHSCGRAICINPHHLRWATRAKNEADKLLHGTSNRGERNGQHKLTEADIREIRRLAALGTRHRVLAQRFGVCLKSIRNINRRRTWGWLE